MSISPFACVLSVVIAFSTNVSTALHAQTATVVTGTADVRDGDTLSLGPVLIRIHGIDAPEAAQRCDTFSGSRWACGAAATARLDALAGGMDLRCAARDVDRYGRVVAVCGITGGLEDVGAVLVAEGLAWAFREYSMDYVSLEEEARALEAGVWRATTQTPWDYRADRWERAAAASPRVGCPIKGNISSDGRRIYHTPWSPYYGRTNVDIENGEQWFCDEGEAQGAGWVAAQGR